MWNLRFEITGSLQGESGDDLSTSSNLRRTIRLGLFEGRFLGKGLERRFACDDSDSEIIGTEL